MAIIDESSVQAVELYDFEAVDVWQDGDDEVRLGGYFPVSPGTPNASDLESDDFPNEES